jgi:putative methyltransferase, YaeB/AF_0241 family/dihydropteroate synthase
MKTIARIHNDLHEKFGLPRQSTLAPSLLSTVVFEPEFRSAEALRGIEGWSHLWLIWDFSEFHSENWSPTVRPPRLGGNVRMGVFATRSPNRPNNIGLSIVKLEKVELDSPDGPVLTVSGADLMDGTPIYDIKPYLPGIEAHPEATDGFVGNHPQNLLEVRYEGNLEQKLTLLLGDGRMKALSEVLSQDPRPAYHDDPDRVYGLSYAGLDIHFRAENGIITVCPPLDKKSMVIINLTPDSFWKPSRGDMEVFSCGADIIDIGAVSTRPGAEPVNENEEWARLEPILKRIPELLKESPETRISIDTFRSCIVRKAYALIGDFIVNDISAGEDDPEMLQTVAELGLTYIAMHKRGTPQTMDSLTDYPEGVVKAVSDYFAAFALKAAAIGIKDWIIDPGFGFAKTDEQNMELLEHLEEIRQEGRPILAGLAHKRFTRGRTDELQQEALRNGADILRIHLK